MRRSRRGTSGCRAPASPLAAASSRRQRTGGISLAGALEPAGGTLGRQPGPLQPVDIWVKRFTLAEAFKKAGVAGPSTTIHRTTARGHRGRRSTTLTRSTTATRSGYRGPTFTYASMPDQYIFSALQRLELGRPHRGPLFAEVDTVSSHMPWNRIPHLIGWNQVGNGSIYNRAPMDDAMWRSTSSTATVAPNNTRRPVMSRVLKTLPGRECGSARS